MNSEVEGVWKEAVVASYEAQQWRLLGGSEETHDSPRDSQALNSVFPEYDARLLCTGRPRTGITCRLIPSGFRTKILCYFSSALRVLYVSHPPPPPDFMIDEKYKG